LLGLPGELGQILEGPTQGARIERPRRSDERKTARKVVGHAAKPDVSGPHLKVGRPTSHVAQIAPGGGGAKQLLPGRKIAAQVGDELRALVPRREPAPPDTDWVAHVE
jgi:hypothetical protein